MQLQLFVDLQVSSSVPHMYTARIEGKTNLCGDVKILVKETVWEMLPCSY